MNIWILFFGLIGFAYLSVGCLPSEDIKESENMPPIALFECVNLLDGVALKRGQGVEVEVVFSEDSDRAAVEALYGLKKNIAAGCGDKGPNRLRLVLVGHFTGGMIEPIVRHNAPESKKVIFHMLGWYIKTPFYEHIQTLEGEEAPDPKFRDVLLESDFDVPMKSAIIFSDQGGKHYGIGQVDP